MEAAGISVTEDPLRLPGIQEYVDAPLAESVALLPLQTALLDADALTAGSALTVIVCVAVFVQPFAEVPVTVYVVVLAGVTETVAPVRAPGIQE